jgi:hypothetical protein
VWKYLWLLGILKCIRLVINTSANHAQGLCWCIYLLAHKLFAVLEQFAMSHSKETTSKQSMYVQEVAKGNSYRSIQWHEKSMCLCSVVKEKYIICTISTAIGRGLDSPSSNPGKGKSFSSGHRPAPRRGPSRLLSNGHQWLFSLG